MLLEQFFEDCVHEGCFSILDQYNSFLERFQYGIGLLLDLLKYTDFCFGFLGFDAYREVDVIHIAMGVEEHTYNYEYSEVGNYV